VSEAAAERLAERLGWAVAALGALLVAATVGFLAWTAATAGDAPPDIVVETQAAASQGAAWRVAFTAFNRGDRAAAKVRIVGELRAAGRIVESRTAELDYLPARSHREGGLFFARDPAGFELAVRADGYAAP
jgi:uncharacterized protein (TIGR02588 family)